MAHAGGYARFGYRPLWGRMPPLRVTYTLSQDQFLQASAALWAHRAIGDRGNWALVIAIALLGGVLLWWGAVLGWGALLVSALVAALTLSRRFFWRSAYQLADKYKQPITVVFTDQEIQTTTWIKAGAVPYSTFKTYLETEHFLLLLIDTKRFSILPKGAFEEGDLSHLRAHLAHHLEPEPKRWV